MAFNSYNHWRNTARPVRFFTIDYRAGIMLFVFLLHIRLWTFLLLLTVMGIFYVLERRGLNFTLAMRRLRVAMTGTFRPALAKLHHRTFHDSGSN